MGVAVGTDVYKEEHDTGISQRRKRSEVPSAFFSSHTGQRPTVLAMKIGSLVHQTGYLERVLGNGLPRDFGQRVDN